MRVVVEGVDGENLLLLRAALSVLEFDNKIELMEKSEKFYLEDVYYQKENLEAAMRAAKRFLIERLQKPTKPEGGDG